MSPRPGDQFFGHEKRQWDLTIFGVVILLIVPALIAILFWPDAINLPESSRPEPGSIMFVALMAVTILLTFLGLAMVSQRRSFIVWLGRIALIPLWTFSIMMLISPADFVTDNLIFIRTVRGGVMAPYDATSAVIFGLALTAASIVFTWLALTGRPRRRERYSEAEETPSAPR